MEKQEVLKILENSFAYLNGKTDKELAELCETTSLKKPISSFPTDIVLSYEDVLQYVMDLSFPEWDTLAREESDIPLRLPKTSYQLKKIPLAQIDFDDFAVDEDLAEDYSEKPIETLPPIVLGKRYRCKGTNTYRYGIIDGCHRCLATQLRGEVEIVALVPTERRTGR